MRNVLIIEDDLNTIRELDLVLSSLNCQIFKCENFDSAFDFLNNQFVDLVISPMYLGKGGNGFHFFEDLAGSNDDLPFWLFYTGTKDSRTTKEACTLGALDVLTKPFNLNEFKRIFQRISNRQESPLSEILDTVEAITGVQLGKEKKLLVETRLLRRMRQVDIDTHQDYLNYFKKNRVSEIDELVSLLTTHTTEFFREKEHFKFLEDHVFPGLINGKKVFRFLSAACSSGEEIYSFGICLFEFFRLKNIPIDKMPIVEFVGVDVDQKVVTTASEGIYEQRQIDKLSSELLKRYFDEGRGDLKGLFRIKDMIHTKCKFSTMNLTDDRYHLAGKFDVIFLRNVLIYFNANQVEKIANNLMGLLHHDGLLFLGHSESLNHVKTKYELVHNAIYRIKDSNGENIIDKESNKGLKEKLHLMKSKNDSTIPLEFAANEVILIGASTGGTEALKVVLDMLPEKFPPILIVQHIPAGFSATFAKRLNETCKLNVVEAKDNDDVKHSTVYIAPGGKQMGVQLGSSKKLIIKLSDDEPVNRHKPSVGYLFNSYSSVMKSFKTTAVIMTGMGADGAQELKRLKDLGAFTIGQDEKSSVVYGMPKVAFDIGAVVSVCSLNEIASKLMERVLKRATKL